MKREESCKTYTSYVACFMLSLISLSSSPSFVILALFLSSSRKRGSIKSFRFKALMDSRLRENDHGEQKNDALFGFTLSTNDLIFIIMMVFVLLTFIKSLSNAEAIWKNFPLNPVKRTLVFNFFLTICMQTYC